MFYSPLSLIFFKSNQIVLGEKGDIVKIRGPKEDVDKCHKHLMKLVKELNESNHVLEVPIFKQFHKFVIGKGGVNIRKVYVRFYCLYNSHFINLVLI